MGIKSKPLKRALLPFLAITVSLFSCTKEAMEEIQQPPAEEPCIMQTGNPAGRSYSSDSVIAYTCTSKHCGLMPLSAKNYWVYQDSIFQDGIFVKVQLDTLRYSKNLKSLSDGLVWWEAKLNVGLPVMLYANDSSFYRLEETSFIQGKMNSRKEFGLITADSSKYLTSFEDMAAQGKTLKLSYSLKSMAGDFNDCLYFEKNSRNYRKDQVFFKPGVGVVRYVKEMAPFGSSIIKLQQVSNLVSYHIE